jgi:hypothetical protein
VIQGNACDETEQRGKGMCGRKKYDHIHQWNPGRESLQKKLKGMQTHEMRSTGADRIVHW